MNTNGKNTNSIPHKPIYKLTILFMKYTSELSTRQDEFASSIVG